MISRCGLFISGGLELGLKVWNTERLYFNHGGRELGLEDWYHATPPPFLSPLPPVFDAQVCVVEALGFATSHCGFV